MTPESAFLEATDKLLKGRYEEGLEEYEVRWNTAHSKPFWRAPAVPQWNGQPLEGKRLFIWHEQGLGDSIMIHRYIAMLDNVTLDIQETLRGLFRANLPNAKVIDEGESVGEFDYHCPTMSLPLAFGTRADTILLPHQIKPSKPYLGEMSPNLNVGIQWAGNINHPDDAARSIPWEQFERITRVSGIKFWGLQRNIRRSDWQGVQRSGLTFLWFDGFDMLAAIVAKMDLIITVDSALAHLSGAMGKPTWNLIQANPDWRWMLGLIDTPWYPSMRLFRQTQIGKWKPVLDHVRELLRRRRDGF